MKQNLSIRTFLMVSLLSCVPLSYAQSDNLLKTSRYSFLDLSPQPDETDILSVVIEIEFPKEIQKVGDALAFLLQNSGYSLEDPELSGHKQYVLYNFDLPEAHRKIGPITLWDALAVIGNDGFLPGSNPLLRTIRYELDEIQPFVITEAEAACARDKWINRNNPEYTPCIKIEPEIKQEEQASTPIYRPIHYGDTLWGIAETLNMKGVAIEQVMAAIFHANPDVFGNNINVLLECGTLLIPDINTVKSVSLDEARELVRMHLKEWHAKQRGKNNG
jgi:FimV-like protein